jgi:hypothetical protein
MPPAALGDWAGEVMMAFMPAPEVRDWIQATFIDENGPLHNPEHQHLNSADFEVLWAAGGFKKQGRQVIGTTEQVNFRAGGWQKERQQFQMDQWFGRKPDFLITLDGAFAKEASDTDFFALVEHELYHIGQEADAFGAPIFKQDGTPKLFIRGHDVEEFVGVVKRYGIGHPGGQLAQLIEAGQQKPSVSPYKMSQACGTCLLRAA